MDVQTEPVKVTVALTYEEFYDEDMRTRVPGAIFVVTGTEDDPHYVDGSERWYYSCPCGCGASGSLRVKAGDKPNESPSWAWNGKLDEAVLHPSVHYVGHWHGWLGGAGGERPGWWISC